MIAGIPFEDAPGNFFGTICLFVVVKMRKKTRQPLIIDHSHFHQTHATHQYKHVL